MSSPNSDLDRFSAVTFALTGCLHGKLELSGFAVAVVLVVEFCQSRHAGEKRVDASFERVFISGAGNASGDRPFNRVNGH